MKQGEADSIRFHLNSPLAFTRYYLIHRHFENQMKSTNSKFLYRYVLSPSYPHALLPFHARRHQVGYGVILLFFFFDHQIPSFLKIQVVDCTISPPIFACSYIFCTCGKNAGKIQTKRKAKYLIIQYLAFIFVPRPGTRHRNHRKTKELISFIINSLHISYFLHFCHILPVFCYSVHF